MAKLIGIFGGTFDPVHQGHIESINLLCEQVPFERVHWVLSALPPHKQTVGVSTADRFAMLSACLSGYDNYYADDTEIVRLASSDSGRAKSYTIDTLLAFRNTYPEAILCVIIGGDSLINLPTWHRYSELINNANWIVMNRPGYELVIPDAFKANVVDRVESLMESLGGKLFIFAQSNFSVSSTELREQMRKPDWPVSAMVQKNLTNSVIHYIQEHQLYKIAPMNPEQIKDQVVDALENVKGQNIKVIDIADISDFADYMVVVSGTSDTHVKALAREASSELRRQGVKPLNEDGAEVGEWVLVDFGDVVLHVMRPEVREYYDLEKLWDEDVRSMLEKHRASQEEA